MVFVLCNLLIELLNIKYFATVYSPAILRKDILSFGWKVTKNLLVYLYIIIWINKALGLDLYLGL